MKVNPKLGNILIALSVALASCGGYTITKTSEAPKKAVFTIESKPNNLEYDCNNFQPQAKTSDDIQAISKRANDLAAKSYKEEKNIVAGNEFQSAYSARDFPRIEKLAFNLSCAELLKK